MNEILISNLSQETLDETVRFISSYQNADESFVAWLGYSTNEIKSQLMALTPSFNERCLIAVDRGVVCGFLGIYVSEDQNAFRLLGPYISTLNNWNEVAMNLLNALKPIIPAHFSMAKVSFYNANVNCKRMYETNDFSLYNAEKTLILEKKSFTGLKEVTNPEIIIRDYHSSDFNEFIQIHPTTAYFTGSEVVKRLNHVNRLLVAELAKRVIGYGYFEIFVADEFAELCFLNVSPESRNRGIGSLLISRVANEAIKHQGICHIQISVRVNNQEAERLYTRNGFKEKNVIFAFQRDLNIYSWDDFT